MPSDEPSLSKVQGKPTKICIFCGKDCTFYATTDGCCTDCGDRFQVLAKTDWLALLHHLIKVSRDLDKAQGQGMQTELGLPT